MADPYIGEIRIFGFSYAPLDWAYCDGQLLPIAQYQALFAILGTTFGGNGQTNFALPNMQGNAPMHWGNGPGLTPRTLGQLLGTTNVTLTNQEMPAHNHMFYGATAGDPAQWVPQPTNQAQLSSATPGQVYTSTATPQVAFSPKAIGPAGQSQPHGNLQPLLTMNFCVCLYGVFPPHN